MMMMMMIMMRYHHHHNHHHHHHSSFLDMDTYMWYRSSFPRITITINIIIITIHHHHHSSSSSSIIHSFFFFFFCRIASESGVRCGPHRQERALCIRGRFLDGGCLGRGFKDCCGSHGAREALDPEPGWDDKGREASGALQGYLWLLQTHYPRWRFHLLVAWQHCQCDKILPHSGWYLSFLPFFFTYMECCLPKSVQLRLLGFLTNDIIFELYCHWIEIASISYQWYNL